MNVLHITVHLGGGIGNSLSGLVAENAQETRIIVLQNPLKTEYIDKVKKMGTNVLIAPTYAEICESVEWADIVVVNWWHHPHMCEFLYNFPEIPCKMVMIAHISGCSYPYLAPQLVKAFDRIIITSKCILDNKFWSEEEKNLIGAMSELVYGLGDYTNIPITDEGDELNIEWKGYKIGYIGTLSDNKIHPQFPLICARIVERIPEANFYLIGDATEGEWILAKAKEYGIEANIHLLGYIKNAKRLLKHFDVFGYPLNCLNYATTENSILEAMGAGLAVVLMKQGTEKYIVEDRIDGLLSGDIEEYIKNIVMLYDCTDERSRLGVAAQKNVRVKFDYRENVNRYNRVMQTFDYECVKRVHSFRNVLGDTPYYWMLSCINSDDRKIIELEKLDELPQAYKANSKSSIYHFAKEYPDDVKLAELAVRLSESKEQ